ncbi:MAG: hypothetical protein ACKOKB_04095, partial [Bacteroidota bacterium]
MKLNYLLSMVLIFLLCLFSQSRTIAQGLTISALGPTDICFGSVALQVDNPISNYQYIWYVGSYTCAGNGSSSPQGPYASGANIQAYGTGEFFCYGYPPTGGPIEISNPIQVRVLPGSIGSILLPRLYPNSPVTCQSSVSLCIPIAFYQGFPTAIKWYRSSALISGATSYSYNATQSGWYKYSITSPCMTDYSDSVQVLIPSTLSTFNSSSPSPVCNFTSMTFTVNSPVAGATYTWQVSQAGGTYLNSGTGTTFNYNVPSTTYFNIRLVQADNGCTRTTAAQNFQVTTLIASVSPSGTVSLCSGSRILTTTSNGISFQWTKDGIDITGANQSTYEVLAPNTGVYRVKVFGNCSGFVQSNQVNITVGNYIPAVTPSGPTTFCSGGSVALTTTSSPNYTYKWFKNAVLISSATSNSLTVTSAGNYSVEVFETSSGCTYTALPVTVVVNPLPTATITTNGPTTFCAGSNVGLVSNTGVGLTYQWKKNGININGATSSTYSATSTSSYKCLVTNSIGCSRASNSISVTVNPLPTASISALGNTQICAGDSVGLSANIGSGLTYQWKKYANPITGAIQSIYYASTTGNYKCVLTNQYGCSRTSNTIGVGVVCKEIEMPLEPNFIIQNSVLTVQGVDEFITKLVINDLTGKQIFEEI